MMTWVIVFVLALAAIIIYFLLRIRTMLKGLPGATSKMNTRELIKNWQNQKDTESTYQNDLKKRAQEAAKPEIERALMEKYKQEAIDRATSDKGSQLKQTFKDNIGLDLDKAASPESMNRMMGKMPSNINEGVNSPDIFSRGRIQEMSRTNINDRKLQNAASSNINWGNGVKRGLDNKNRMSGVEKALYRDQPPRR
jgi:hypothetical protein